MSEFMKFSEWEAQHPNVDTLDNLKSYANQYRDNLFLQGNYREQTEQSIQQGILDAASQRGLLTPDTDPAEFLTGFLSPEPESGPEVDYRTVRDYFISLGPDYANDRRELDALWEARESAVTEEAREAAELALQERIGPDSVSLALQEQVERGQRPFAYVPDSDGGMSLIVSRNWEELASNREELLAEIRRSGGTEQDLLVADWLSRTVPGSDITVGRHLWLQQRTQVLYDVLGTDPVDRTEQQDAAALAFEEITSRTIAVLGRDDSRFWERDGNVAWEGTKDAFRTLTDFIFGGVAAIAEAGARRVAEAPEAVRAAGAISSAGLPYLAEHIVGGLEAMRETPQSPLANVSREGLRRAIRELPGFSSEDMSDNELEDFIVDTVIRQGAVPYNENVPARNIYVLSTGEVVPNNALLAFPDRLQKALDARDDLTDEQKNNLLTERSEMLESHAVSMINSIIETEVSEADRFHREYLAAKDEGVSDGQFLETWLNDPANSMTARRFFKYSLWRGIAHDMIIQPARFAAFVGARAAGKGTWAEGLQESMLRAEERSQREREFFHLIGQDMNFGDELARTAPPVLADVFVGRGISSAVRGTLTSVTSRAVRQSLSKAFNASPVASRLVKEGASFRNFKMAQMPAYSRAVLTDMFNSAWTGIRRLPMDALNFSGVAVTSGTRIASHHYSSAMLGLQDYDMTPEERHEYAFRSAMTSGVIGAAVVFGMLKIGRGGVESLALDKMTFRQFRATVARIQDAVTVGGVKHASLNKALAAAVKEGPLMHLARKGAKGFIDEGIEETFQESIDQAILFATLNQDVPFAERVAAAQHAFLLGGTLGAGTGVAQSAGVMGFRRQYTDPDSSQSWNVALQDITRRMQETGSPQTAAAFELFIRGNENAARQRRAFELRQEQARQRAVDEEIAGAAVANLEAASAAQTRSAAQVRQDIQRAQEREGFAERERLAAALPVTRPENSRPASVEPTVDVTSQAGRESTTNFGLWSARTRELNRQLTLIENRAQPAVRIDASPHARRVAQEKGVDLATVEGTGPRGKILARDVERAPEPTEAQKKQAAQADRRRNVGEAQQQVLSRLRAEFLASYGQDLAASENSVKVKTLRDIMDGVTAETRPAQPRDFRSKEEAEVAAILETAGVDADTARLAANLIADNGRLEGIFTDEAGPFIAAQAEAQKMGVKFPKGLLPETAAEWEGNPQLEVEGITPQAAAAQSQKSNNLKRKNTNEANARWRAQQRVPVAQPETEAPVQTVVTEQPAAAAGTTATVTRTFPALFDKKGVDFDSLRHANGRVMVIVRDRIMAIPFSNGQFAAGETVYSKKLTKEQRAAFKKKGAFPEPIANWKASAEANGPARTFQADDINDFVKDTSDGKNAFLSLFEEVQTKTEVPLPATAPGTTTLSPETWAAYREYVKNTLVGEPSVYQFLAEIGVTQPSEAMAGYLKAAEQPTTSGTFVQQAEIAVSEFGVALPNANPDLTVDNASAMGEQAAGISALAATEAESMTTPGRIESIAYTPGNEQNTPGVVVSFTDSNGQMRNLTVSYRLTSEGTPEAVFALTGLTPGSQAALPQATGVALFRRVIGAQLAEAHLQTASMLAHNQAPLQTWDTVLTQLVEQSNRALQGKTVTDQVLPSRTVLTEDGTAQMLMPPPEKRPLVFYRGRTAYLAGQGYGRVVTQQTPDGTQYVFIRSDGHVVGLSEPGQSGASQVRSDLRPHRTELQQRGDELTITEGEQSFTVRYADGARLVKFSDGSLEIHTPEGRRVVVPEQYAGAARLVLGEPTQAVQAPSMEVTEADVSEGFAERGHHEITQIFNDLDAEVTNEQVIFLLYQLVGSPDAASMADRGGAFVDTFANATNEVFQELGIVIDTVTSRVIALPENTPGRAESLEAMGRLQTVYENTLYNRIVEANRTAENILDAEGLGLNNARQHSEGLDPRGFSPETRFYFGHLVRTDSQGLTVFERRARIDRLSKEMEALASERDPSTRRIEQLAEAIVQEQTYLETNLDGLEMFRNVARREIVEQQRERINRERDSFAQLHFRGRDKFRAYDVSGQLIEGEPKAPEDFGPMEFRSHWEGAQFMELLDQGQVVGANNARLLGFFSHGANHSGMRYVRHKLNQLEQLVREKYPVQDIAFKDDVVEYGGMTHRRPHVDVIRDGKQAKIQLPFVFSRTNNKFTAMRWVNDPVAVAEALDRGVGVFIPPDVDLAQVNPAIQFDPETRRVTGAVVIRRGQEKLITARIARQIVSDPIRETEGANSLNALNQLYNLFITPRFRQHIQKDIPALQQAIDAVEKQIFGGVGMYARSGRPIPQFESRIGSDVMALDQGVATDIALHVWYETNVSAFEHLLAEDLAGAIRRTKKLKKNEEVVWAPEDITQLSSKRITDVVFRRMDAQQRRGLVKAIRQRLARTSVKIDTAEAAAEKYAVFIWRQYTTPSGRYYAGKTSPVSRTLSRVVDNHYSKRARETTLRQRRDSSIDFLRDENVVSFRALEAEMATRAEADEQANVIDAAVRGGAVTKVVATLMRGNPQFRTLTENLFREAVGGEFSTSFMSNLSNAELFTQLAEVLNNVSERGRTRVLNFFAAMRSRAENAGPVANYARQLEALFNRLGLVGPSSVISYAESERSLRELFESARRMNEQQVPSPEPDSFAARLDAIIQFSDMEVVADRARLRLEEARKQQHQAIQKQIERNRQQEAQEALDSASQQAFDALHLAARQFEASQNLRTEGANIEMLAEYVALVDNVPVEDVIARWNEQVPDSQANRLSLARREAVQRQQTHKDRRKALEELYEQNKGKENFNEFYAGLALGKIKPGIHDTRPEFVRAAKWLSALTTKRSEGRGDRLQQSLDYAYRAQKARALSEPGLVNEGLFRRLVEDSGVVPEGVTVGEVLTHLAHTERMGEVFNELLAREASLQRELRNNPSEEIREQLLDIRVLRANVREYIAPLDAGQLSTLIAYNVLPSPAFEFAQIPSNDPKVVEANRLAQIVRDTGQDFNDAQVSNAVIKTVVDLEAQRLGSTEVDSTPERTLDFSGLVDEHSTQYGQLRVLPEDTLAVRKATELARQVHEQVDRHDAHRTDNAVKAIMRQRRMLGGLADSLWSVASDRSKAMIEKTASVREAMGKHAQRWKIANPVTDAMTASQAGRAIRDLVKWAEARANNPEATLEAELQQRTLYLMSDSPASLARNQSDINYLGLRDGDASTLVNALHKLKAEGLPEQQRVADILLRRSDVIESLQLAIVNEPSLRWSGRYVEGGVLALNLAQGHGRGVADTMMHEIVHAMTSRIIENPTTEQDLAMIRQLDTLRDALGNRAQELGMLTDPTVKKLLASNHEMVALLLTDSEAQSTLSYMQPSAWKRFWNTILNWLGVPSAQRNQALFDAMNNLTDVLTYAQDRNTFGIVEPARARDREVLYNQALKSTLGRRATWEHTVPEDITAAPEITRAKEIFADEFARTPDLTPIELQHLAARVHEETGVYVSPFGDNVVSRTSPVVTELTPADRAYTMFVARNTDVDTLANFAREVDGTEVSDADGFFAWLEDHTQSETVAAMLADRLGVEGAPEGLIDEGLGLSVREVARQNTQDAAYLEAAESGDRVKALRFFREAATVSIPLEVAPGFELYTQPSLYAPGAWSVHIGPEDGSISRQTELTGAGVPATFSEVAGRLRTLGISEIVVSGEDAKRQRVFEKYLRRKGVPSRTVQATDGDVETVWSLPWAQTRSTEVIVRNAEGNIVPLSQRFDTSSPSVLQSPSRSTETTNREQFIERFRRAQREHPRGYALDNKPDSFFMDEGTRLFMSPDGNVLAAVSADGTLNSVVRMPEGSKADLHRVLSDAAPVATKLDAFETITPLYARYGFYETGRVAFDPQYAPPGWNYARDGRPDVVFMERSPTALPVLPTELQSMTNLRVVKTRGDEGGINSPMAYFNPARPNEIAVNFDKVSEIVEGLTPKMRRLYLDSLVVHEQSHAAAFEALGEQRITEIGEALTEAELAAVQDHYVDNNGDLLAELQAKPEAERRRLMAYEYLRMQTERMIQGYTDEQVVHHARSNPGFFRNLLFYVRAFFNRLSARNQVRHNPRLAAEMDAIIRKFHELRRRTGDPTPEAITDFDPNGNNDAALSTMEAFDNADPFDSFLGSFEVPVFSSLPKGAFDHGTKFSRLFRKGGDMDIRMHAIHEQQTARLRAATQHIHALRSDLTRTMRKEYAEELKGLSREARDARLSEILNGTLGSPDALISRELQGRADDALTKRSAEILARKNEALVQAKTKKARRQIEEGAEAELVQARREVDEFVNREKDKQAAAIKRAVAARRAALKPATRELVTRIREEMDKMSALYPRLAESMNPADRAQRVYNQRVQTIKTEARARKLRGAEVTEWTRKQLEAAEQARQAAAQDPDANYKAANIKMQFDRSLGIYVTRTYRIHKEPGFYHKNKDNPEYAQAVVKAKEFFREEYIRDYTEYLVNKKGKTYEQALAQARRKEADQNIGEKYFMEFVSRNDMNPDVVYDASTRPGRVIARLMKKDAMPEELATILGVETNVLNQIAETYMGLSQLIANEHFLSQLADVGVENGWFITSRQKKADPDTYATWGLLYPSDDKAAGPMAGLFAAPETLQAFRAATAGVERTATDSATKAMTAATGLMVQATGWSLALKTMGSVGFYIRNHLSNVLYFGPMNGYNHFWNQDHANLAKKLVTKEADTYLLELSAMNVVGDDIKSQTFRDMLAGVSDPNHLTPNTIRKMFDEVNRAKDLGQETMDRLARLTSAVDAMYKIGYYENELAVLRKANKLESPENRLTDVQLKQKAAEIVKATAQSHSQTVPVVKSFTRAGVGMLIAPFARFKGEVLRTSFNTLRIGFQEIRGGNPIIKQRGRRRLIGSTLVLGALSTSLPMLMRALAGIGDDEEYAIRESLPYYAKNSTFFYIPWGEREDGSQQYYTLDLTFVNPYAIVVDPIMRGIEAANAGRTDDFAGIAARALTQEWFGKQIAYGALTDVIQGTDQASGRRIYGELDSFGTKLYNSVRHIVAEAYAPRTPYNLIVRGGRALQLPDEIREMNPDEYAGLQGFATIFAREFVPAKPRRLDPDRLAENFSRITSSQWREVRAEMGRLATQRALTDREINNIYRDIIRKRVRLAERINRSGRGFSTLGVSNREFRQMLTSGGMSRVNAAQIVEHGIVERPLPTPPQRQRMMTAPGNRSIVVRDTILRLAPNAYFSVYDDES